MIRIKILLVDPSYHYCNITYIDTINKQYQVYEDVKIIYVSEFTNRLLNSLIGVSLDAIYVDSASSGRVFYDEIYDKLNDRIPVYEIKFKSNIIDF